MFGQNNSISTKRLATSGGKDTYPGSYNLTSVPCYLERAAAEVAIMFENVPAYEVFSCIMDDTQDIIISDLVVDEQGEEYIVRAISKYDNNPDIPANSTELTMVHKYDGS